MTLPSSNYKKKARDYRGMKKEKKEKFDARPDIIKGLDGFHGRKRTQAKIVRDEADCEVVVGEGSDNNAFIIIGNDRVEKLHTGYGGQGNTQSDAIDIVAGMGGHSPREVDKDENTIYTNPNFFIDSARIYISQKTDVDKNFGIGKFGKKEGADEDPDLFDPGEYGAKSAIVTKADNIRIIGRESIRIVTGTDAKNSQGGDCLGKSGVEIIAMNDTTNLQPMVLGDNLSKCLATFVDHVVAVNEQFHAFMKYQMKFNQAVAVHGHTEQWWAKPGLPSQQAGDGFKTWLADCTKTELSVLKLITMAENIKTNYLTHAGSDKKSILSRLNKVN